MGFCRFQLAQRPGPPWTHGSGYRDQYSPRRDAKLRHGVFPQGINIANTSNTRSGVKLYIKRDDGAAVYLSWRGDLSRSKPSGRRGLRRLYTSAIPDAEENVFVEVDVSRALLFEGRNVLAVEVHQSSITSSDVRFDVASLVPLVLPVSLETIPISIPLPQLSRRPPPGPHARYASAEYKWELHLHSGVRLYRE